MPERKLKTRNANCPYKLLVLLMYGTYEWCSKGRLTRTFSTSKAAQLVNTSNSRLLEYLEMLATFDIIEFAVVKKGVAHIKFREVV